MNKPSGKSSIETRLLASLQQAVEIHKGQRKPARSMRVNLTARNTEVRKAEPVASTDVSALRREWKVSQAVFARAMNVSTKTVQSWEQGARAPTGAALRLLDLAVRSPAAIRSLLVGNPTRPHADGERRSGKERRTRTTRTRATPAH